MSPLDSTDPHTPTAAPPKRDPANRPIDFTPVTETVPKRWGPNPYLYAQVIRRFVHPSQRLLQVRCGVGVHALRFAHLGYQTFAVDEREDRLVTARRYARRYGLASRCEFQCAPASGLPYPDDFFDLVLGFGVLHGTNAVAGELARVTKHGGVALLVERFAPADQAATPGWHSTVRGMDDDEADDSDAPVIDESWLQPADLDALGQWFSGVECERFTLEDRLTRMRVKVPVQAAERLGRLDVRLRDACPPLADLSQTAVLVCAK